MVHVTKYDEGSLLATNSSKFDSGPKKEQTKQQNGQAG